MITESYEVQRYGEGYNILSCPDRRIVQGPWRQKRHAENVCAALNLTLEKLRKLPDRQGLIEKLEAAMGKADMARMSEGQETPF